MFCNKRGIKRQTSAPRTPPQNGIFERRNIFVVDYARTLMREKNVTLKYWREAISTTIYTLNRVQVMKGTHSTPFELWYGYSPNVKYFKVFGRKCYILKDVRNRKLYAKLPCHFEITSHPKQHYNAKLRAQKLPICHYHSHPSPPLKKI